MSRLFIADSGFNAVMQITLPDRVTTSIATATSPTGLASAASSPRRAMR